MAAGCSSTIASDVSIFNFPKNEEAGSQVDYAGAVDQWTKDSY